MISLLRLLAQHRDAVEADLSRWHRIDLRDMNVIDHVTGPDGRTQRRRRLSARMIAVRLRHLPSRSAVHGALGLPRWDTSDYLLADLFHAQAGKAHPGRPKPQPKMITASPARVRKLAAARRRAHQRQQAIDAGEIT